MPMRWNALRIIFVLTTNSYGILTHRMVVQIFIVEMLCAT